MCPEAVCCNFACFAVLASLSTNDLRWPMRFYWCIAWAISLSCTVRGRVSIPTRYPFKKDIDISISRHSFNMLRAPQAPRRPKTSCFANSFINIYQIIFGRMITVYMRFRHRIL